MRRNLARNPHLLPNFARTIKRTIPPLHISRLFGHEHRDNPKEPRLAPGNTNAEEQTGDGGVFTAMRRALKMPTRTRLCPPCPLSGGKHPRRRDAHERQATRNTSQSLRGCTGGYGLPTRHSRSPCPSRTSGACNLRSLSRRSPGKTPFPPHRARRARARGHRTRRAAHDASRDTGCSRPGR